ncbi:aminotransferase class I/II-fold pyridoxal phosphate-dependent enzyme, partial [Candidatus Peregrinibacteria bacterium]|nr:aminotransferase class I/II-fold pyridoxal phosphate-dependent enzyme [Candidatus Peregrinibacteria bacterium]
MPVSSHASELNDILRTQHPSLLAALSKRGRSIYFPHAGILGQTAEAKGKPINATIGIGVGDDGVPLHLSSIASRLQLPPALVFPYAPGFGLAELRSAWSEDLRTKNPSLPASSFTLPVVTAGLTHSLSIAGYLFADEDDAVIVPDPHWDNYGLLFEETYGAKLMEFPLFTNDGFNLDGLRSHLESRSGKLIILLNFPNNPTGYSPLRHEAKSIVEVFRESAERGNTLIVLLDDAYFGLTYEEDVYPESLFSLLADLHERVIAVKIDGCSKEDYAWGLRVGFLIYGVKGLTKDVARVMEDKTAGAVRATVSNACHLSQSLLLASLREPSSAQDRKHHAEL